MVKINFDWRLINLDNSPMEVLEGQSEDQIHAGKLVSGLLARATEAENPIKFFDWALKLYNKQSLELDDSDFEVLKKFIKTHKGLFAFAQAQLLTSLSEAKEASEKREQKKKEEEKKKS